MSGLQIFGVHQMSQQVTASSFCWLLLLRAEQGQDVEGSNRKKEKEGKEGKREIIRKKE